MRMKESLPAVKNSLAGKEIDREVGGWSWKGIAFFVADGEDRGRERRLIGLVARGEKMLIGGGRGGRGGPKGFSFFLFFYCFVSYLSELRLNNFFYYSFFI